MNFGRRSVVVVTGVSGYGKSTFGLRFLANADGLSFRLLFDPEPGEFNPKIGEYADRHQMEPTQTPFDLARHLVRGTVILDPHSLFPGRMETALDFFCD